MEATSEVLYNEGVQGNCRAEDKRASQTPITSNQIGQPSVDRQNTV